MSTNPQDPPLALKTQQAVALHQQGQLAEAEALYREILQADSRHFDALHLLGVIALQAGHCQSAADLIGAAISINPGVAEAHSNLGLVLRELKRPQEALASFDHALQLKPDYAEAFNNRGNALQDLKRYEDAVESYAQALRHWPDYVDALYNQGITLQNLGRLEEALANYDRVLQIQPDRAEAHDERGTVLQELNRLEDALESYQQALRLRPDCAGTHNNYGRALLELHRLDEALAGFAQALRIDPGLAIAHWNEGLARLLMGDFARGWQKYEWRWETKEFALQRAHSRQPLWLGEESLQGKTILLHAEQGLGDTLQFCRYAKRVAELGATVWLEAQAELKPLLAGLEGVSRVFARGEALPPFDCQCPLLSLPLAFKTRLETIPAKRVYLRADPRRVGTWQARLGNKKLPRVGLAWSGNASHRNDHNRSIALAEFGRLAVGPLQFVSLQKELREADRLVLQGRRDIADYSGELRDFADTAALIANLDLVVAVDTAVAHLAAMLGKPVWLLLPFNADWRWLLDREDSPWYPTARLFRQATLGDWGGVIARVAEELRAFKPGKAGRPRPPSRPQPPSPPAPAVDLAKVQHAIGLHQQGRLAEAEALYREILQADPRHFDALHLLGVIALQEGQAEAAVDLISQAISVDARQAIAHSNLGTALQRLGRSQDALASYDRALRLQPDYAEALNNRGIALRSLGRVEEAVACYDRALRLRPDYAEALGNRGNALQDLNRLEDALASYTQALRFAPNDIETCNNLGIVLRSLRRPEEAKAVFDRALQLMPGYLDALNNRGTALLDLRRPEEALADYGQVLRLAPDHADALYNRGVALQHLHRLDEALASYDQALRLKPEFIDAHINRGLVLQEFNRTEEALACYAQVLRLKPDLAEAHWNESLSRLVAGDFAEGWKKYEWRWQAEGFPSPRRPFQQPLWLGLEPLRGRTILLHAEQGLGDTIQFCRYAQRVAALGATVLLEVQPPLKTLLAGLAGVSQIFAYGEPLPAFDCHCPLLSLPLAFGTRLDSIPQESCYLRGEPGRIAAWGHRLGGKTLPRIGLAWSGSAENMTDHKRSIPLGQFGKLLTPQAQFVSLQKELREADRAELERHPEIAHYGDELFDFAETAALAANLDGVVSVDTAVAHLAAALGKPVWLLLPFSPDWRWLLGRDDSPWYPTARLFRQDTPGDWDGVIARLAHKLSMP